MPNSEPDSPNKISVETHTIYTAISTPEKCGWQSKKAASNEI